MDFIGLNVLLTGIESPIDVTVAINMIYSSDRSRSAISIEVLSLEKVIRVMLISHAGSIHNGSGGSP